MRVHSNSGLPSVVIRGCNASIDPLKRQMQNWTYGDTEQKTCRSYEPGDVKLTTFIAEKMMQYFFANY